MCLTLSWEVILQSIFTCSVFDSDTPPHHVRPGVESSTSRVGPACGKVWIWGFPDWGPALLGPDSVADYLLSLWEVLDSMLGNTRKEKRDSVCVSPSFNKDCHPLV